MMSLNLPQTERLRRARLEVEFCLKNHETEPEHTRHVAFLALALAQSLKSRHELGELELFLLESAALLHDIGWSQTPDGRGHHKHSYRMMMERKWSYLSPREVHLMALTARYHRKSLPERTHEGYSALPPQDQMLVQQLASFVRVADALDRSHMQRVRRLLITDSGSLILLRVESASATCREELKAVERKKDLFEQVWCTVLQAEVSALPFPSR